MRNHPEHVWPKKLPRAFRECLVFAAVLLIVPSCIIFAEARSETPTDSQNNIEDQVDWLIVHGRPLDRKKNESTRYQFIRGEWRAVAMSERPRRLHPSEVDDFSDAMPDSFGLRTMSVIDRIGFALSPCSLLIVRYERNPSIYPYVSGYGSIILSPGGRRTWNPLRCERSEWLPEKQEELLRMVFPATAFARLRNESDYLQLAKEVVSVLAGVYPVVFIKSARDIQLYSDIVNSETLWWIVENDSMYSRIFSSPFVYDTKPIEELEPKVPSAFDTLAFCFLSGIGPSVHISGDPEGLSEVVLQTWLPMTGNLYEWRIAFSRSGIEKVRHYIIARKLGIGLGSRAFRDE